MDFLEKLNLLMEEKGISRAELAKGSGVPYTTIVSFYDKGYDNAKLSTLKKLAAYLDCSLDYLVDDTVAERNYIRSEGERVALHTQDSLSYDDLPLEAIRELNNYKEFLKQKYGKKK